MKDDRQRLDLADQLPPLRLGASGHAGEQMRDEVAQLANAWAVVAVW